MIGGAGILNAHLPQHTAMLLQRTDAGKGKMGQNWANIWVTP
jgi:hypothetical protein